MDAAEEELTESEKKQVAFGEMLMASKCEVKPTNSQLQPSQPQAIRHYRHRTERHRRPGDHGIQQKSIQRI